MMHGDRRFETAKGLQAGRWRPLGPVDELEHVRTALVGAPDPSQRVANDVAVAVGVNGEAERLVWGRGS